MDTQSGGQSRRGRKPSGAKLVDAFDGSALAKRRLKVILQTLSGELRVADACERLGINQAAFYKMRRRFLDESVAGLEPRKPGRRAGEEEPEEVAALCREIAELTYRLRTTEIRARIARTMPHLLVPEEETPAPAVKKKGHRVPALAQPVRQERAQAVEGPEEHGEGQAATEDRAVSDDAFTPARLHSFAAKVYAIATCRVAGADRSCRGPASQMPLRDIEHRIRCEAAALSDCRARRGRTLAQMAGDIGINPQLLYTWRSRASAGDWAAVPRGRRPLIVSAAVKAEIFELMELLGPFTGVPALREYFPAVARREMQHLAGEFRRRFFAGKLAEAFECTWQQPGVCWAMDYTAPPLPIDGIYRKILDVRDLGSGKQLAALPVPEESGIETALLLESLFARYGPPLVIKSDNGSSLVAAAVKKVLKHFGVIFLLSPPYYPQYNGACEAGHGAIKVRAHHLAARAGRPGQWSCDDVEAARLGVNELSRPKGFGGPSPNVLWDEKKELSDRDRGLFRKLVADKLRQMRSNDDEKMLGLAKQKRLSVSRALVKLGYLLVRRRRIPLRKRAA